MERNEKNNNKKFRSFNFFFLSSYLFFLIYFFLSFFSFLFFNFLFFSLLSSLFFLKRNMILISPHIPAFPIPILSALYPKSILSVYVPARIGVLGFLLVDGLSG